MKNLKIWQKNWLLLLLSLFLGAVLTFAFAPYQFFPLSIVSTFGLLALFLNASPKQAFLRGFFFGLGFFGLGVYWVYISIHNIGEVPIFFASLITTAFICILALFPALVGYISNRYFPSPKRARLLYIYPAIWVFSEWIRGWIATGFPWLFLGYSQTNSPLKGYAPIFGVFGISFLIMLTSAWLLDAYRQYQKNNKAKAYYSLLMIFVIWLNGGILTFVHWTTPEKNSLSFALVQGNIPQTLKWSPEHLQLSLQEYQNLTESLWKKNRVIIWPEAAIPIPLQEATHYINLLNQKALTTQSQLILGIPIQSKNSEGYYNAVVTLGAQNQVYLKRFLVPFGEFTPFSQFFADTFTFMNIPMSNMVPGNFKQQPLQIENTKILTSICYEIAFPDLIRTNDPTIGLLLTITNDAWFGDSNAQAQHLQMAAMRAIEFRRPLVFVSNDGITAVIGEDGHILAKAPTHVTYILESKVTPRMGLTLWMRYGSDSILFISICFLIVGWVAVKKNKTASLKNSNKNIPAENQIYDVK